MRFVETKKRDRETAALEEGRKARERGSELVDDAIGETVRDGFLGVEIEIAIGVLIDALDRLARGIGQNLIQLGADFLHFFRLNVDVGGGPDHATGNERLMDEHS